MENSKHTMRTPIPTLLRSVRHLLRKAGALAVAAALVCTALPAQNRLTVEVANPDTARRGTELVELDADRVLQALRPAADEVPAVWDEAGRRLPCQLTHDGKLLFAVNTDSNALQRFTLTVAAPLPADTVVRGRVYAQRLDDLAWENDQVAFRAYGPALQKRGERGYGYDAFAKRVAYPVLDKWYDDELSRRKSYHQDHGEGLDCYNVGPTLGCGTSALVARGDSIVYPWCYARCEVLDNGPLRFTARLTYAPFAIDGDTDVTEVRLISLDLGSKLNRTVITYEGLSRPTPLVTGLVIHSENPAAYAHDCLAGYIAYEDPTGNPRAGNGRIYVGAVFPTPPEETGRRLLADTESRTVRGVEGHVVARTTYRPSQPYIYYWGNGWSKADTPDMAAWETYLKAFARRIAHPLLVSYAPAANDD